MKETKLRSNCPVSYSLDVLGDKWTLLILRDMLFKDKTSYGEFLGSVEKIATNIPAGWFGILFTTLWATYQPSKPMTFPYCFFGTHLRLLTDEPQRQPYQYVP
jgi:hypothetical protein